jgi:hypothetical protein
LAAGVIAGCSVLLGACSSSATPPTSAPPQHTGASVIAPGGTIPFDLAHNARADLVLEPCTQTSGRWVLRGTVTNSSSTSKSFQIVVDFVTRPGSTVLSTTVVEVAAVGPHTTAHWSATGAAGKSDVACIVRQAQTT